MEELLGPGAWAWRTPRGRGGWWLGAGQELSGEGPQGSFQVDGELRWPGKEGGSHGESFEL